MFLSAVKEISPRYPCQTKHRRPRVQPEAFQALKDGRGVALAHDSLLLYAWAQTNPGFTIVNEKLEEPSPIAPAVKKGNNELREWINNELTELGKQNYLHKIYDEKLKDIFGAAVSSPDEVVTEGGILK